MPVSITIDNVDLLRDKMFWAILNAAKNGEWSRVWRWFDYYADNLSISPFTDNHFAILTMAKELMTDKDSWRFTSFFSRWLNGISPDDESVKQQLLELRLLQCDEYPIAQVKMFTTWRCDDNSVILLDGKKSLVKVEAQALSDLLPLMPGTMVLATTTEGEAESTRFSKVNGTELWQDLPRALAVVVKVDKQNQCFYFYRDEIELYGTAYFSDVDYIPKVGEVVRIIYAKYRDKEFNYQTVALHCSRSNANFPNLVRNISGVVSIAHRDERYASPIIKIEDEIIGQKFGKLPQKINGMSVSAIVVRADGRWNPVSVVVDNLQ